MLSKIQLLFEETKQVPLKIWHFLLVLVLLLGLSFGLFILGVVLFWAYYPGFFTGSIPVIEEALILIGIYTIVLVIIIKILKACYRSARRGIHLGRCKSYLWVGIMFIFMYMVLIPLSIESF